MPTMKVWNGTSWDFLGGAGVPITRAGTPPQAPNAGDIWVDTATSFAQGTLLKAEYIVSGSAVTSVTFSDLDGNADGGYVLEGVVLSAGSQTNIYLGVNGDTTSSHYEGERCYFTATTVSASTTVASTGGLQCGMLSDSGVTSHFIANVSCPVSDRVHIISHVYGIATSAYTYFICGKNNTSISNITSIVLTSGTTSGIAVSSVFRLYKRK